MLDKLQYKHIVVKNSDNKKKIKFSKPWWCNTLSVLWNSVCDAESNWLKCKEISQKRTLKSEYILARKLFDREFNKLKRAHWVSFQNELMSKCENGQHEFGKTIGRIGVAHSRKSTIPMEIVYDDGSVSNNVDCILAKWRKDFSDLFLDKNNSNIVNQSYMRTIRM